jgi:hypothetical protein
MYKLGETLQKDGFLELRQEGDLYLLSIGDCFDDGGEGVCMPLFSFTKKLSKERVEGLIKYLEFNPAQKLLLKISFPLPATRVGSSPRERMFFLG